ncbi:MAG: succinate--CoA ligase subunit alpha [Bradyrhizobiaceae bacterium]|nr:MAG: succinate--CoA ligase subunit alpha [Bradyrhizobiaceae bacterium]
MIYRRGQKVLVQGITGKQGTFWTEKMREMGTDVIGGVNPKRAGETYLGLPVYATAVEAAKHTPIDVSVIFIPPAMAKEAMIDAIDAGVGTIVALTEHIPGHDVLEIFARLKNSKSRIIGPNTAGIVTPGEGFVGIMPGHNPNIFMPGDVGVISRSGSLGTLMCLNLTRARLGQSAFIGIGGDPIIGTTTRDALMALDRDSKTKSVVLVGEIGGGMEEEAAEYARGMKKPIVSFIAGRSSPPDKKMGHAGAIVTGGKGGYATKRAALEKAGVRVADTPAEVAVFLSKVSKVA